MNDDKKIAAALARSLERDYPDNALTNMRLARELGIAPTLCGRLNPTGDAVCTRPRGHGVTNMTLPDGHRTYVDHCASHDGLGEGWG